MERKMRWALGPMTGPEARQVTEWQYPAPYEMYNWAEEDDPAELLDGSYLACREESGALGGFLCFGPNATIPTREDVYRQGYLDVGLGLRPDLCGRGLGRAGCFRLAVAQFNLRAQKVYRACGFREIAQVTHGTTGDRFLLMVWEPSERRE